MSSTLSASQQAALAQLRDLTNGGEDDVAVSMLESVDWDVQRAAELIFGVAPPPPRPQQPHQRPLPSLTSTTASSTSPSPNATIIASPCSARGMDAHPPRSDGGADRWVRELEEETGALCMSSAAQQNASGVDVGTSSSAGPSTLSHRAPSDRKVLPDFTLGTYEDALRTCQRDARIACIVLVSEEHDDVPEFKRTTLTDTALVRLLHANDILVWGGDVRDREAYSASLKLQATTYPFVAFVALQPKRTPRSANSSTSGTPTLTVLSRHQGPPSGPTSPAALAAHLETQLLPRVSPFLAQLRAAQHAAFADRALREEQDRAARAKREAEEARVAAEIEAAKVASQRDERERRARGARGVEEVDTRSIGKCPRGQGRGAARGAVAGWGTGGEGAQDERSPKGHAAAELERAMEEQIADAEGADAWWGFQLVLAYPRREIPWASGSTVGDVECLKGGAQLVVHLLTPLHETVADGEADDDGYVSED
ncbi:UBX domain-containing protein [Mycena venus]|uniref:UBX domain-containing protein n=1 Tax=Mycena venus TaxID=2733690 RepID=A0A8H7CZW4_9AGAR|nr:UBX domain-containing protein [Mycena venus]